MRTMGGRGPRTFDAVAVGSRETDAWVSYYRHEWGRFLVASAAMVGSGFGMGPLRTLLGAWHVLRANQLWAPIPDNDADAARADHARRAGRRLEGRPAGRARAAEPTVP